MHVVVAGGSGFIGRSLVERLSAAGHRVTILSRRKPEHLPSGCVWHGCDLVSDSPALPCLEGASSLVNLVGIKSERGENTYDRVHVAVVHRLIEVCREVGIERLIHVSVAGAAIDPADPYRDSKARGEECVAKSGLSWLVLRPGIVYGPGDDFMTNVIDMVQAAPIVPVPGRGHGLLQVVDVEDVVAALIIGLESPVVGRYDIVGPARIRFCDVIQRVAGALRLPTLVVPMPVGLQQLAARVFERLPGNPLVTRAQIRMLVRGVIGDSEPTRHDLGIEPRALTDLRIRELAQNVETRLPSIRLRSLAGSASQLDLHALPRLWPLLVTVMLAMLALPTVISNLWWRMAGINVLAAAVALAWIPLPWRDLWRVCGRRLALGVGAAMILYGLGALTYSVITGVWPHAAVQVEAFRGFATTLPLPVALPLLVVIVAAEDCFWRGAVALPLASRYGPWSGSLAGAGLFAIAHVTSGPAMLVVAALLAGWFWNLLALRTRSLTATVVAHASWDIAVLWVLPY